MLEGLDGREAPARFACALSKLLRAVSVRTKSLLSGLYFTGRLRTIAQVFKLNTLGPSTKHPLFLYSLRRLFQRSCLQSTFAFPKMTSPYFARVNATLSRRGSFKKPMPEASLLLTQERRMKSFSLP